MPIEIQHSPAEGTLVHGTSRGDGTNTILKAAGFRWFRTLGVWGIAGSRDRQSNRYKINRAADQLRAAGHEVTVAIDDSHRDAADVEADRAQRQENRTDALLAKADRKADAAEAAWDAEHRAVQALPPGGEPIHVGHHREGRHRRAIERAHNATRKAIEATEDAEKAQARAQAAARTTERRYNPVTVKNRLDKLEADQRADQRQLDGHRRVAASSPAPKITSTSTNSTRPPAPIACRSKPACASAPPISPTGRVCTPSCRPPGSPAHTAPTPSPKVTSSDTEGCGTAPSASTARASASGCTNVPRGPTRSATTKSAATGPPAAPKAPTTSNPNQSRARPASHPGWPGPLFSFGPV